jgi:hypothetical protein
MAKTWKYKSATNSLMHQQFTNSIKLENDQADLYWDTREFSSSKTEEIRENNNSKASIMTMSLQ